MTSVDAARSCSRLSVGCANAQPRPPKYHVAGQASSAQLTTTSVSAFLRSLGLGGLVPCKAVLPRLCPAWTRLANAALLCQVALSRQELHLDICYCVCRHRHPGWPCDGAGLDDGRTLVTRRSAHGPKAEFRRAGAVRVGSVLVARRECTCSRWSISQGFIQG